MSHAPLPSPRRARRLGAARAGSCWLCTALLGLFAHAAFGAEDAQVAATAEQEAPPKLATQGPEPPAVTQPPKEKIDAALKSGADFLVKSQGKEGWWGSARDTKGLNIYAPSPGAHHAFRSACTGLAAAALVEYTRAYGESPEVAAALERAEKWMVKELPRLKRATPDALYNVWGHGYAITGLVRLRARVQALKDVKEKDKAKRIEKIEVLIKLQQKYLERFETVGGGWAYYDFQVGAARPAGDSSSFTTGAILVALKEAEDAGLPFSERLIKRAARSIIRQQKPDYSYAYGEYLKMYPMYSINRPGGSLGRSQCCNAALRIWGDKRVNDGVLRAWLNRLYARNGWLDIGRKRPIPHESWFAVAGYFYYFGHYYAGYCVQMLPEAERAPHQDHLATIILSHQQNDGGWWDYPFYAYHKPYGTAFAMSTLLKCRR